MSIFGVIFYILAVLLVATTVLAITRRNLIHAVVYLILSFIATGLLFYLLGAPFLALLEIIIYAGAIMVLFLFIIIMIRVKTSTATRGAAIRQWWPALILGAVSVGLGWIMVVAEPKTGAYLPMAQASPSAFGRFLFDAYWFPVEIVSFLLLVALVGAFYLGRSEKH
jgi:NADH-quinone oxidoreductase subunit J